MAAAVTDAPPPDFLSFLFRERRLKHGPTLAEFWGAPQDDEEESMRATTKERVVPSPEAMPAEPERV